MTTQDIIDHLKAGRPLTKNVAKEIIRELERVKALEEALRPIAKMWIDTKAVFISEGEELPIGLSIDAVSLPQWVDISSAQLDDLCKALEATCQK